MADIPINVLVGGRDVVASGSLITTDSDIKFTVADLKFVLQFESTEDKKLAVEGDVQGDQLIIKLKNFDNQLGSSWHNKVAELNGRILTLGIFVHTLGSADKKTRVVNYTFSLGEVVSGQ